VDEEVTTEEWNDPARDIMKIKFRERYGLGSVNNGQGSGLIKGINLAKNFDFGNNISVNFTTGDFAGNPLSGDSGVTTAFYSNNY
jgi:hypothetical protein